MRCRGTILRGPAQRLWFAVSGASVSEQALVRASVRTSGVLARLTFGGYSWCGEGHLRTRTGVACKPVVMRGPRLVARQSNRPTSSMGSSHRRGTSEFARGLCCGCERLSARRSDLVSVAVPRSDAETRGASSRAKGSAVRGSQAARTVGRRGIPRWWRHRRVSAAFPVSACLFSYLPQTSTHH